MLFPQLLARYLQLGFLMPKKIDKVVGRTTRYQRYIVSGCAVLLLLFPLAAILYAIIR